MRRRAGKIDIFKIFLTLVVVVGGTIAWFELPHQWVKYKMDEVVQLSILEWRDKSLKKAEERLPREMDKKTIPNYILVDDCKFYEERAERHLSCYWAIDVTYPLVNKVRTLEFRSHKYLDASNHLETID